MMKQTSTKEILVIAIKLLVICSIVATIVAAVNYITADKIAYNEKLNTAEALTGIYFDNYGKEFEVDGNSYVISDDGNIIISCKEAAFDFSTKTLRLFIFYPTPKTTHSVTVYQFSLWASRIVLKCLLP